MFTEIGLEHPVDHRAERERWLANRATIAALAAALLAFTGVIATVAGLGGTVRRARDGDERRPWARTEEPWVDRLARRPGSSLLRHGGPPSSTTNRAPNGLTPNSKEGDTDGNEG